VKDRGLWEKTPQQIFEHGRRSTLEKMDGERSESKLLETWQKNQNALARMRRGSSDYTLALGVREALKELCKKRGISDPSVRIEWLSRHGKKS